MNFMRHWITSILQFFRCIILPDDEEEILVEENTNSRPVITEPSSSSPTIKGNFNHPDL